MMSLNCQRLAPVASTAFAEVLDAFSRVFAQILALASKPQNNCLLLMTLINLKPLKHGGTEEAEGTKTLDHEGARS
jgi:hypothetical protein